MLQNIEYMFNRMRETMSLNKTTEYNDKLYKVINNTIKQMISVAAHDNDVMYVDFDTENNKIIVDEISKCFLYYLSSKDGVDNALFLNEGYYKNIDNAIHSTFDNSDTTIIIDKLRNSRNIRIEDGNIYSKNCAINEKSFNSIDTIMGDIRTYIHQIIDTTIVFACDSIDTFVRTYDCTIDEYKEFVNEALGIINTSKSYKEIMDKLMVVYLKHVYKIGRRTDVLDGYFVLSHICTGGDINELTEYERFEGIVDVCNSFYDNEIFLGDSVKIYIIDSHMYNIINHLDLYNDDDSNIMTKYRKIRLDYEEVLKQHELYKNE